jgi:hypothetical protein
LRSVPCCPSAAFKTSALFCRPSAYDSWIPSPPFGAYVESTGVGVFVEKVGGFVVESVDGVLLGLPVGDVVGESVDGALVESLFSPFGVFFSIRTSSSMCFLGFLVAFGSLLPFGCLEDFGSFFNTREALNDVAKTIFSFAMILLLQRRDRETMMEQGSWQSNSCESILGRSEDYESDGYLNSAYMLETIPGFWCAHTQVKYSTNLKS